MSRDIRSVTARTLCTGCATCTAICPAGCISMRENARAGIYEAHIDLGRCIRCGLCLSVCPQSGVTEPSVGGQTAMTEENFAGNTQKCFTGSARDGAVRAASSSGGMAAALGLHALESGLADGIITTGADDTNALRFAPQIARTRDGFLKTCGSKYCPVALNGILRELLDKDDGKRYMYIGLPCHVKGLKKLMHMKPGLESKITCTVSLFCSHTPTFHATAFLLARHGVRAEDVKDLSYRGRGWPGTTKITTNDGGTVEFPSAEGWRRYFAYQFFSPRHCLVCDDLFGRESDISLGDAWLPEFGSDKKGTSIGMAHTQKGLDLIESCRKAGAADITETTAQKVSLSQAMEVRFKRDLLPGRKRLLFKDRRFPAQPRMAEALYNRLVCFYAASSARPRGLARLLLGLKGAAADALLRLNARARRLALSGGAAEDADTP